METSRAAGGCEPRILLLGDPVDHSVSPAMHNAALRALGLAGRYEAVRVPGAELPAAVDRLRRAPYLGANVTVPHKQAVLDAVDTFDEEAEIIGAINTIVRKGSLLHGANTDAPALLAALESALGAVPYGMRILLLGAGGAARAAAAALLSGGPAELIIYNRGLARAEALARDMLARFGGRVRAVDEARARDAARDVDLVINATSAGMDGQSLPLEGIVVRPGAAAYDIVYTPSPTPLMRRLAAQGAPVADGLDMLVHQAARSFAMWTDRVAPFDVMHSAALDELRRRGAR